MADDDVGAKLSFFAVFWRQPKKYNRVFMKLF
jgi:hypothetical protein